MNNAQSSSLSETIKKESNHTNSWTLKYRPDLHISQRQKLNESLQRERQQLLKRKERVERLQQRQQNRALGNHVATGDVQASQSERQEATDAVLSPFLSQTKRDFRDPRTMKKDRNGNYINALAQEEMQQAHADNANQSPQAATRARMNLGANHNNVSANDSFATMTSSLKQNQGSNYTTHRDVHPQQEQLLYEGVSKEGQGRRAFLQARGQMLPQERYNEAQTSSQEVGWFSTHRNPYAKFENNQFNRRKHGM